MPYLPGTLRTLLSNILADVKGTLPNKKRVLAGLGSGSLRVQVPKYKESTQNMLAIPTILYLGPFGEALGQAQRAREGRMASPQCWRTVRIGGPPVEEDRSSVTRRS